MSFKKFSAANDPANKGNSKDTTENALVADQPPAPAVNTPAEVKPTTKS